ncbi:hypothetical protein [Agrobacterium sp. LMR679]|uniref:hypothetical protein n=1 Tax=Agrobacterium sp. LMR679 TaxID=3014335 RepID=UPI0022AF8CF4|nr:hypothetical protein [Agrobacterium sp. LMR679]MCZ4076269.1 hypothetical protein [Agrobacterium sp. LMR679]
MAGGKSYRGWKPAKAQHQALTPKQPIPAAKSFRAISAMDPVPDQSKMTATQALMVQRMAGRTSPFPEKPTTRPEVLEGNPASGNDGREDDEGGEGAQSRLQRRNGRLYLRHDEKSGSLSSGNVAGISDDLKAALNRFGFTSVEAVASAYCHARVGESFLKAIEVIREHDGPFKDWAPANDPVEIIHDLYAALEHAREKAAAAPALDPEGSPASSEAPPEADSCPVCDVLFKPDDMCAIDIEMGTCHAECLDGTPVVDLDTGEPSSGPVLTFRYDDEKVNWPARHLSIVMR